MAPVQDLRISWDELSKDASELAAKLRGTPWTGIIAVARGGLIPAALIAQHLNIKRIETVCIASYEFQVQGKTQILGQPKDVAYGGQNWIVIDDLTDTGNTFEEVRKLLPAARYACLYAKPAGVKTTDIFIREVAQDTWVHFPWETGKN